MTRRALVPLFLLLAASAQALVPEPGDVYFVSEAVTGAQVHHVDASSGATTLVARGGHIVASYACCLTVAADGRVWLIHNANGGQPARLVRIDPTAFDPDDPIANQELVLEGSQLFSDVGALAAVPAPLSASVAAVPPWFAGAAGMLMLFAAVRARRRNGITKQAGGC